MVVTCLLLYVLASLLFASLRVYIGAGRNVTANRIRCSSDWRRRVARLVCIYRLG